MRHDTENRNAADEQHGRLRPGQTRHVNARGAERVNSTDAADRVRAARSGVIAAYADTDAGFCFDGSDSWAL